MKIKSVEVVNYRNYTSEKVNFYDGLNVLVGSNAQGKTNLVEAINFCSIGKSHRTNRDKDLIKFDADFSKIKTIIDKNGNEKSVNILISKNIKKVIKINGLPILKMGELMGNLNCIFFSPNDLKLVQETPEERRHFLDVDLSQMSKVYFYNLMRYNRILNQRNKLLKDCFDKIQLKQSINIWNEQLADVGSKIIIERVKFIEKLNVYASQIHSEITHNEEKLELIYSGINSQNPAYIKNMFLEKLNENIEKDIKLGFTTFGAHRDDIKIICNDIDIRTFGSQGQQRTVALSLKLAELEIFYVNTGEYPILLLDDVLSELDESRCKILLEKVTKIQTILTCTEFKYKNNCHLFEVINGKCNEIKQ